MRTRTFTNAAITVGIILGIATLALGFERLTSDIATRIKFAIRDGGRELFASRGETLVIELRPNGWPNGCRGNSPYKLILSPDKGESAAHMADIFVECQNGQRFATGTKAIVSQELSVHKAAAETVRITLRPTRGGVAVIRLE